MQKPPNSPCTTCPLAADETCTGFSNNEGTGRIPLMFVGEALGANELTAALPFRPEAQAGSRLEAAIRRIGRDRQDFTLTNIVRGRPHNNKLSGTSYEQTAIQNCRPYLIQTIEKAKPKVIVALGDIAYRALTGLYGRNTAISKVRGYFIWSKEFNCHVLPTFHPSFVVRGGDKLLPVLMADIKQALEVAEGVREVPRVGEYQTIHKPEELLPFLARMRDDPTAIIAYDIETSMSSHGTDEDTLLSIMRKDDDYTNVFQQVIGGEIADETEDSEGILEGEMSANTGDDESLQTILNQYRNSEIESIQFSLAPGTGIFIPYTREYISAIAEILASPNTKISWNGWIFDSPILKRNGFRLNGLQEDLMWSWHHSQPDQPASLQYVASFFGGYGPWKHLSDSQPELYGSLDVDNLQRINAQLPNDMKQIGIWDSYTKFVRDFHPILERMQDRGMRIDLERRDIFEVEVELATEEIDKTILANVPPELHGMQPADGIKQWNGDLKRIRDEVMAEANSLVPKKKDWVKKFADLHPFYQIRIITRVKEELGDYYKWGEFSLPTGDIELRPYKVKLFNPNSTQQLMEYMKLRGIPIPKSLDGKATTGKKELERVAKVTKDVVLTNILELRKQRKVVSTYVQGWQVGGDSAVHTTFTFAPATWQLSSRNPNIQNVPKHGEFAKKFRECIVASPGHTLIECVAPNTRILKWDLTWAKADDMEIGDYVVGFDEDRRFTEGSNRSGRYLTKARVEDAWNLEKPCVKIITDKGTVTCSKDHYWLARHSSMGSGMVWVKSERLRVGQAIGFFTHPWEVDRSYDAGWLAGFLDGEGYVGRSDGGRGLGFGQNDGAAAVKAIEQFQNMGFNVMISNEDRDCKQYAIGGQPFSWVRAIGMLRPVRLLPKVMNQIEGMAYWGKNSSPATILAIEDVGVQEVVAIKTSSRTFIAEGLLSHNCDYKSFHMLTLGFCAGDAKYMRMARLDGHSYTASHLLKIPEAVSGKLDQMSDDEFKDYIKWFKSDPARKFVRDKKAKPTILGYGFGLGARKLYDMNIESFANQKEAQGVIDMLDRLFPLASKFREEIKQKAHRQKYLISPWGAIRRFNSVFVRDIKYGGWKGGDDAERAIAFLPANCAFGKIREAMIHLAEEGLDEKYKMINTVHDSLVFDCPLEFRDEAIYKIKEIMERPGSVLIHPQVAPDGLSCEVEVSEGENWGNIVEVKL